MTIAVPSAACHAGSGTFEVPFFNAAVDINYQTTLMNQSAVVADCVIYLVLDGATSNVTDAYESQWLAGYARRDTTFKTVTGLSQGSHTWDIYVSTASLTGSDLTVQSCAVQGVVRGA